MFLGMSQKIKQETFLLDLFLTKGTHSSLVIIHNVIKYDACLAIFFDVTYNIFPPSLCPAEPQTFDLLIWPKSQLSCICEPHCQPSKTAAIRVYLRFL